ncbi:MAG: hypothetical protein ABH834_06565 [Candidatus Altiarchaeota archaeon]
MALRRRKNLKAPTETTPYYMCTEVSMKDDPDYGRAYDAVSHLSLSKGTVDGNRLIDEQQRNTLKLVESKCRVRGVSCAACYLDYLTPEAVNVGVYFDSETERDCFTRTFGDELTVLSMATFDKERGEYKETYTITPKLGKQSYPGHGKNRVKFTLNNDSR